MPATLFTKVLPSDQDYSSDQDHPSDQDYSSDQVHHQPIAVELLPQASQEPGTLLVIQQISIFSLLPSELVIEIFNHLDILTIFRFLDTCRYHRYLLLNLPDVWRRVRFIPLSEYATTSSTSSRSTPLSIAAAAAASSPRLLEEPSGALTPNSSSSRAGSTATAQFAKAHRKGPRQGVRTRGLASASGSKSEESQESTIKEGNRIKHSEDERDRDRGGSRTLISEIYAVLRRFRKENHLVDFVREVCCYPSDSLCNCSWSPSLKASDR
ncbi:hypothetical protein BC939DRAFT_476115 [Gamsiella multidivaricata]|uniref:uncharacterized protein n=1 Tax=Gamsiella multidivaricata TaxID=101098 RepID=UPI00221F54B3|nr:uncharacterized protein BC939DRAFT_476115 [Gamsiella multidivaricata]KAI7825673.1 hypothetical protein BC939DRAFT_476115 [Gamsiella multidivaricata]